MKKALKRSISMVMALTMLSGILLPLKAAAAETNIDRFATMYDSNTLFAEKVMPLLKEQITRAEIEAVRDEARSDNRYPPSEPNAESFRVEEREIEQAIESVLDAAQRGELATAADSFFMGDTERAEQVKQIYENTRVDRFIVKYKSDNANISKVRGITVQSTKRISRAASQGSTYIEVVQLAERVNPAELADQLREAGLENKIEYIQPDFLMEYAGSGSSTVENEPGTEAGNSKENPGATGAFQSQKAEVTANNEAEEPSEEVSQEVSDEVLKAAPNEAPNEVPNELTQAAPSEAPNQQSEEATEPKTATIQPNENEPHEILVALIDTAVDINHEALQGHLVQGWNFVDNSADVYDPASPMSASHGTHIAGIIAQNSGEHVKILPLQVFGPNGAYTSSIISAIYYAEEQGAYIANMSFGSTNYNPALEEAIASSTMLCVVSAGNARSILEEYPVYPAAFELKNGISVASVNEDGGFSFYSNYSTKLIDICAQGRDVYSALPEGQYGIQSGTSMSAGFVTAAAAAVLANEDLTTGELKARLLDTADRLSNLQNKVANGRRLNQSNAVSGETGAYQALNPKDDFDIHGYHQIQNELWETYSAAGGITAIAAGGYHVLVLKEDGSVWSWGSNEYGQCGNGATCFVETLTQVVGITDAVQISAGYSYSMAIKADGTLWAWGNNLYGQLGDGSTTDRTTPVQVIGLSGVVNVAAKVNHSLAVKNDGSTFAWGFNNYGQLGDGTTTQRTTPVPVNGMINVKRVAVGNGHSLAVKNDGTIWAWGNNEYGQLGNGSTTNSKTPIQLSLSGVSDIAANDNISLALKTDGSVFAWGRNNNGQLGDGSTVNRSAPTPVNGLTGVRSIAAGYYHSLAVKNDGSVWSWGYNSYGQLGDGTCTQRTTPAQISGMTGGIFAVAGI
jgi:alpha-tubulin suppressor-like RCC1 family protein